MKHVVIIGGGITGLSAAWYLQQLAEKSADPIHYTLLESSDRWGGKVWTEQVDGFGDAPFVLEFGPDAFLTRKPWALELAQAVGLESAIQTVKPYNSHTFVLHKGKPLPLPEGLQLLVPTRFWPFVKSPLFTLWGKMRMALDLVITPRMSNTDESLASFVKRRLGAEALDKLAEPLLGGVYNGESDRQSILATFPQFPAQEKKYGSLIKGSRTAQKQRPPNDSPAFISFITGTQTLVNALQGKLDGDLKLNTSVERISTEHDGYSVKLANGNSLQADAVIITTSARIASKLLPAQAIEAKKHLGSLRYSSIGTAYFAFRQDDVPHPLNGFGLVVPASEKRLIDGMTWTTSKWKNRAPAGYVLIRLFFGGPRTRSSIELSDDLLVNGLREELRAILGITAQPLFRRIYRWIDGYPQYDVGHIERVAQIEAALPKGIFVDGSSYKGVGVPDCVRQGKDTARHVVEYLANKVTSPMYPGVD